MCTVKNELWRWDKWRQEDEKELVSSEVILLQLTAKGEKGHPGLQGSVYPNHYNKSLKKVSPNLPILITNTILLTGTNNMDHAKEVNAFLS